jgi:hypothetical protein
MKSRSLECQEFDDAMYIFPEDFSISWKGFFPPLEENLLMEELFVRIIDG